MAQISARVNGEFEKMRCNPTEQQTVEIAREQAQVEICGGGETIEQRRDGIQNEHRYGGGGAESTR